MNRNVDTRCAFVGEAQARELPDYLVKTYSWAYLNPASLRLLDNPIVVTAILWGNIRRLTRVACSEFRAGQSVLQAASVYGRFSSDLASAVGPCGRLDVIDIAPLQVAHAQRKLAAFPQVRVRVADAAAPGGAYDGVCCFFLLHEIPDDLKGAVVGGLLDSVPPGGKVVFVDYHRAAAWHPLKPLMDLVFHVLEPYAHGLISREIADFASEAEAFSWHKTTYFGGLYQKVVAVRRAPVSVARRAAE